MVKIALPVLIGILTGTISGMGIGGGTLLVLYLTAVADTQASAAAGINLLYFLGCAPASLWFHIRQGRIAKDIVLPAALVGAISALVTALLAPADSPPWLRRGFGVLLLIVGVRELWQVLVSSRRTTAESEDPWAHRRSYPPAVKNPPPANWAYSPHHPAP